MNDLPALDSSCDPDDSVVWTSIFRSEENSALLGEAWKLQTLQFWRYVRILPDNFFLRQFFGKLLSVPRAFGSVFS